MANSDSISIADLERVPIEQPPSYKSNYESKPSLADSMLWNFPYEIPEARTVVKHHVNGSERTLVHVRQMHLTDDISKEDKIWIKAIQGDIFNIITYLSDTLNLEKVYCEGIRPGSINERKYNEMVEFMRVNTNKTTTRSLEEEVLSLFSRNKPSKEELSINKIKSQINDVFMTYDGAFKAAVNSKDNIYLEGVDKTFLYYGIMNHFRRANPNNSSTRYVFENYALENRENFVLESLSNKNEPILICVYGGGHSLEDNIDEWNLQNPNNKFSLIEITPINY